MSSNPNSTRVAAAVAAVLFTAGLAGQATAAQLPNGVAAGDVTDESGVLWARTDNAGTVRFEISGRADLKGARKYKVTVSDTTVPAKVRVDDLDPARTYYYRATDAVGNSSTGRFRTSPSECSNTAVRFGVSGDWRGELAPYPSIRNAPQRNLDFFVEHGDTIYAERYSGPQEPTAATLAAYRSRHNEVMSERFGLNTWRDLRGSTAILATIDDHEVVNDFAGGAPPSSNPADFDQTGAYINETRRYRAGLQAFHEYMPIEDRRYGQTGDPRTAKKPKLFRSRTYGNAAAVIVLDNRSFRDTGLVPANLADPNDVGRFLLQSFDPSRTMLGAAQLAELKKKLLRAQQQGVVWKFVLTPEPVQNLGVLIAEDRFEGYAAERTQILKFIADQHIDNVVFVTADIHGTLVNNLTYQTAPFQPQVPTGAFEISTGAVAFEEPFGPTVAGLAAQLGFISPAQKAYYDSLPAFPGLGKDNFIEALVNGQTTPLGYDPVGLASSPIQVTKSTGGYVATHIFGWTEFNVDRDSKALTVTTYGVPSYTYDQLQANTAAVVGQQPTVWQTFSVQPVIGADFGRRCDSGEDDEGEHEHEH
jgi:3-phytase/alkaline phosphatase D